MSYQEDAERREHQRALVAAEHDRRQGTDTTVPDYDRTNPWVEDEAPPRSAAAEADHVLEETRRLRGESCPVCTCALLTGERCPRHPERTVTVAVTRRTEREEVGEMGMTKRDEKIRSLELAIPVLADNDEDDELTYAVEVLRRELAREEEGE